MTTPKAKTELLRLSQKKDLDQAGRELLLSYQKAPRQPNGPIAVSGEKSTTSGNRVESIDMVRLGTNWFLVKLPQAYSPSQE